MKSLAVDYMGLKLKNPVILGSSSLTDSLDKLKKAEDAGYGAVVLKSIFQEQIASSTQKDMDKAEDYITDYGAYEFLKRVSEDNYTNNYLELVSQATKALEIPVIASINCTSEKGWIDYAAQFASCGAKAIELNVYQVASNSKITGASIDDDLVKLAKTVKSVSTIPVAFKISPYHTSVANLTTSLSKAGLDGIVMFNNFRKPDIDIDKVSIHTGAYLSNGSEWADTLRWTALMSAEISTDICASTGIRDAETVIKMILAGAKAVQISSAAYTNGIEVCSKILDGVSQWMDKHNFETVEQFRAKLAQEKIANPEVWERAQYIKENL